MAVTGDLGGKPVTLNNAAEENTLQDIKSLLGQTTKAANINANNINSANVAAGKAAGGLSSVANSSGYASKSLDNVSNSVRRWSKDARDNIAMATSAFGRAVTTGGTTLSQRIEAVGGAANTFASKTIPFLGGIVGGSVGVLMGQVSGLISTYEKAQASGGSFGNSMQEFISISNDAGLTMGQLANITQVAGKDLALFGGTTAAGGRQFAKFNKDLRNADVSKQLIRMGMSIEQQGIAMAEYTGSLARYGVDLQSVNPGEVTKGMADLTRQQKMFAAINGTTLDQERQKAKQEAMNIDSRSALMQLDAKDRKTGESYITQMQSNYGESGAQFAREILAHGQAVSASSNMFASQFSSVAGPMEQLGKSIRGGTGSIEDISNAMGGVDQSAFAAEMKDAGKVAALTVGTGLSNGFTEMVKSSIIPLADTIAKLQSGAFASAKADSDAVVKPATGVDNAVVELSNTMQEIAQVTQSITESVLGAEAGTKFSNAIGAGAEKFGYAAEQFSEALNNDSTFTVALGKFTTALGVAGQDTFVNTFIKKIGSFFGGDGPDGKALGGPVSAHSAYVVGEQGPELLQMGSQGGSVMPNSGFNQLMGGLEQQIAQLQQMDLEKSIQSLGDGDSAGIGEIMQSPTASVLDNETKDAIMALPGLMTANLDAVKRSGEEMADGLNNVAKNIA